MYTQLKQAKLFYHPPGFGAILKTRDYMIAVSSDTNSYWVTISPADTGDGE